VGGAYQRRRGLKKVGAGHRNFSTAGSCKFPADEIMGAQSFNFASKLP